MSTGVTGLLSNRYRLNDMPDLTGKVAIVSGGSRGIGEALTSALVKKGCEVHIVSATKEHMEEAEEHVAEETPLAHHKIHHHEVDFHSLRALSSYLPKLAQLPRIDMLYLIAGIGVAPFRLTDEGVGNHFQVNNVSQMMFVDSLLPKMVETSKNKSGEEKFTTRIVSESSELHRAAPSDVKCDSIEEMSQDNIDPMKLYGRSKLFNALFIRELAKSHLPTLSSDTPIIAISVHPGAVATEQQQGATEAYGIIPGKLLEGAAKLGFMSKEQGAESALWAGTAKSVTERREEVQGRYFSEADGKVDTESNQAKDDTLSKKLWDLSVKTLQEKAGYTVKI